MKGEGLISCATTTNISRHINSWKFVIESMPFNKADHLLVYVSCLFYGGEVLDESSLYFFILGGDLYSHWDSCAGIFNNLWGLGTE